MKPVVITGGAGFIGTNLAHRLLNEGNSVIIFDNFSRKGSSHNVEWLKENHSENLRVINGDVCEREPLGSLLRSCSAVFHLAAQVAVTRSLENPVEDFETNLRGTLNILETLRTLPSPPFLLFTSTNKVYGNLSDIPLFKSGNRYEVADPSFTGINELRHLDFHSPYGCSKGGADQYVIDYARTFSIPATVLRMSCIYGPHQYGNEDQGWVAHLLIRAVNGEPVTIFGNGLQVRDILYVDDLVDAFLMARREASVCAGQAFTMGGGPGRLMSVLGLLELIEEIHGTIPEIRYESWRTGDQKYYMSNTGRFQSLTGWYPRTHTRAGVEKLYRWIMHSGNLKIERKEYNGNVIVGK